MRVILRQATDVKVRGSTIWMTKPSAIQALAGRGNNRRRRGRGEIKRKRGELKEDGRKEKGRGIPPKNERISKIGGKKKTKKKTKRKVKEK